MTVNNTNTTVNSTAKNFFYSMIPFGSEYYIYSSADNEYTMLLRRVGHKEFKEYVVRRSTTGDREYQLVKSGVSTSYTDVTLSKPYYAYSSEPMQGVSESLPCMGYMNTMMLVVLASCAVLCVVFGGIKLWRKG